jgi:hypothetical protein
MTRRSRSDPLVLEEMLELRIFILTDGGFERDRPLGDFTDLPYLLSGHVHLAPELVRGGLGALLLGDFAGCFLELVDFFDDMDGLADDVLLVGERAGDCLTYPPRRVGGELEALGMVEFLDRPHQAEIAFLDEVEEAQALGFVLLGDGDDQPQVGGRQLLPGGFLFIVPVLLARDDLGEMDLLIRSQQRDPSDLPEVDLDGVIDLDVMGELEVAFEQAPWIGLTSAESVLQEWGLVGLDRGGFSPRAGGAPGSPAVRGLTGEKRDTLTLDRAEDGLHFILGDFLALPDGLPYLLPGQPAPVPAIRQHLLVEIVFTYLLRDRHTPLRHLEDHHRFGFWHYLWKGFAASHYIRCDFQQKMHFSQKKSARLSRACPYNAIQRNDGSRSSNPSPSIKTVPLKATISYILDELRLVKTKEGDKMGENISLISKE